MINEHKQINDDKMWKSCCINMDKNATIFFSQLFIALTTITFCIYQLSTSESCEHDSLYSGIFSMVIGCYMPQPTLRQSI